MKVKTTIAMIITLLCVLVTGCGFDKAIENHIYIKEVSYEIGSFNPNIDSIGYTVAEAPAEVELGYELLDENTVRIIFD